MRDQLIDVLTNKAGKRRRAEPSPSTSSAGPARSRPLPRQLKRRHPSQQIGKQAAEENSDGVDIDDRSNRLQPVDQAGATGSRKGVRITWDNLNSLIINTPPRGYLSKYLSSHQGRGMEVNNIKKIRKYPIT